MATRSPPTDDVDDRLRAALLGSGPVRKATPTPSPQSAASGTLAEADDSQQPRLGRDALDKLAGGTFKPDRNILRKGADMFRSMAGTSMTPAATIAAKKAGDVQDEKSPTPTSSQDVDYSAEAVLFGGDDTAMANFDVDRALDSVLMDIGPAPVIDDSLLDDVDDRLMQFQEDPLVKEALAKGVDLREYGRTIEKELTQVERESVQAYINQGPDITDLHRQIQMCDQILETMETLLTGFQEDLGSISAEIQTLQTQSSSMQIKLRNRKTLQAFLENYLEEVSIPPNLINHIIHDEVNDAYLRHLTVLSRKMAFVKERERRTIPSIDTVLPELDKLRLKATDKVRDFLLEKVHGLKKPKTNPSVLQKQLINYRPFNAFLLEHHPACASEIHDNYVQIMNNYYQRNFARYTSVLAKLQHVVAEKIDLLGAGESANKGLFGGRVSMKERANVFRLGDRLNTLTNINADVLVPHVAESNNQKFPYEVIFRSIERMLMDNSSTEYTFIVEFFSVRGDSASTIFQSIFESSLAIVLQTTRQYVEDCFDAVGILLCIRINNAHQRLMQQRRIPCLEPHMNATNLVLWPRLQQVMDLHVRSIKSATMQTIGPLDVQAHYVTRRYADMLMALLMLNEGQNDQPVLISMARLRNEMEQLFLRYAADFTDRRNFLIYFINQYDLIISTLRDAPSPAAVESELEYWTQHMNKSISEFVEEELSPAFGALIQFVKQSESIADFSDIEVGTLEKISVNFATHWKQAIANINTRVSTSFVNQKNASSVVQVLLRQLLFYYSKFVDIIEKRFGRSNRLPFRSELVGLENVKFEIKRFLPNA